MARNLHKIQIKTNRDGIPCLVHFCYIEKEIKQEFDTKINIANQSPTVWISKWAGEDFGSNFSTKDFDSVEELKEKIKLGFREVYPDIWYESVTDRQGWCRAWYQMHIKKEIRDNGM